MNRTLKISFLSSALAVLVLPVVAQTTNSAPVTGQTIQQRKENQQDRIAQGIKSGQLTPGEAAHLEGNEAKINKEVHNDRAANGGKLTAQERAQVNHQQNRMSQQIYRDKHNGRHQ
ncbi:MAG TPA: hypothetical protein VMG82_17460 [Candidatus Sulfotelmatobacter sp.]|nr:hypothetical protein [Candidatus Sulfotelmatobacter sp.]